MAFFLWGLVARTERDPGLLTRYRQRYSFSPVPDVAAERGDDAGVRPLAGAVVADGHPRLHGLDQHRVVARVQAAQDVRPVVRRRMP